MGLFLKIKHDQTDTRLTTKTGKGHEIRIAFLHKKSYSTPFISNVYQSDGIPYIYLAKIKLIKVELFVRGNSYAHMLLGRGLNPAALLECNILEVNLNNIYQNTNAHTF